MILCGNRLLRNNFVNTFCEISLFIKERTAADIPAQSSPRLRRNKRDALHLPHPVRCFSTPKAPCVTESLVCVMIYSN